MNFAASAESYAKFRVGFPPSFFEKVPLQGVVLDLGAGTGALAQGYAAQGCVVCAVDVSAEMLAFASGPLVKLVARAESCTFAPETFDAIVVGQAWHWFDGELVARNCLQFLKPGGRLVIASLEYRVERGSLGEKTEGLILRYNPAWPLAGFKDWLPERQVLLQRMGFGSVAAHEYDEAIVYSKEAWRGRMQACNGVMVIADAHQRARFDADLAQLLQGEVEPMAVPHRISWVVGHKPRVGIQNPSRL